MQVRATLNHLSEIKSKLMKLEAISALFTVLYRPNSSPYNRLHQETFVEVVSLLYLRNTKEKVTIN